MIKLDILVFAAHPDDAELGAGATIAKEVANGSRVGIVDLTRGELGTRGSAAIRNQEAASAAKILGISVRENVRFADGFFVNDQQHQLRIIEIIRKYQPEIVLCNSVEDRHIDHGRGSKLVSDACFLSGLRKIVTQQDDASQEAWRPKAVYHYIQWKNLEPDFVVDVTGYMNTKMQAVKAYASQLYDSESDEPDTPISSKNFLDSIEYRARDMGRIIGTAHGEGFTIERYVGVKSIRDLI